MLDQQKAYPMQQTCGQNRKSGIAVCDFINSPVRKKKRIQLLAGVFFGVVIHETWAQKNQLVLWLIEKNKILQTD